MHIGVIFSLYITGCITDPEKVSAFLYSMLQKSFLFFWVRSNSSWLPDYTE